MIPPQFVLDGPFTDRQKFAMRKVFKDFTFPFEKFGDQKVTVRIEECDPWGGLYYSDGNLIKIDPDTIGAAGDEGRMRIAVRSLRHEICHAVDDILLTPEKRQLILDAMVCPEDPCGYHVWRCERYVMRANESFADCLMTMYSDSRPGVDRGHKWNADTKRVIREVLT